MDYNTSEIKGIEELRIVIIISTFYWRCLINNIGET